MHAQLRAAIAVSMSPHASEASSSEMRDRCIRSHRQSASWRFDDARGELGFREPLHVACDSSRTSGWTFLLTSVSIQGRMCEMRENKLRSLGIGSKLASA